MQACLIASLCQCYGGVSQSTRLTTPSCLMTSDGIMSSTLRMVLSFGHTGSPHFNSSGGQLGQLAKAPSLQFDI